MEQKCDPLSLLPIELAREIACFLGDEDLYFNITFVCEYWRQEIAFPIIAECYRNLMMEINGELEENLSSFNCLFTTKYGRRFLRFKLKSLVFEYSRNIFQYLIINDEKMICDVDEWLGMETFQKLVQCFSRCFHSEPRNETILSNLFERIERLFSSQEVSSFVMKIVIEGHSDVGKSSFIQCVRGNPVSMLNDDRTMSPNFSIKEYYLKDVFKAQVQLFDTPNPQVYTRIPHMFFRNSSVLLLIFDVTLKSSFERISQISKNYVEQLREKNEHPEIMIIGTKTDLDESLRVVSYNEALELAFKHFNGSLYFELSNTDIKQPISVIWYCLIQRYLLQQSLVHIQTDPTRL